MCRRIRSYQITNGFNIKVTDFSTTPPTDITNQYQNIIQDESHRRIDAFIDVNENGDGQIRTLSYRNPRDPQSMASFRVLFDIYMNDINLGRI
jgi:hypothetical protein